MTTNEHSHANSAYMTLAPLGVLHVEGEDGQSLLQNLLTNDVDALAINQSQITGLCNPKGRLLAIFLLVRRHNRYQLILPKTMCAGLKQRLSMYILRSKVTISDVSDSIFCMGLSSATGISSLTLPDESYQATEHNDSVIIKYPSSQPRFLFIGPTAEVNTLISELAEQQWQVATPSQWELLDMEAGLPMIWPETKEQFTTQQVNLDLVNGVSFKKGCYPGQEIVARLHYLGTPSRRMFQGEVQTQNSVEIGDEVTSDNGNIAGHVVRVEHKNKNTLLMLLSLKLSAVNLGVFVHHNEQVTIINNIIAEEQ
jgi:folate-binding protein YgfZ